MEIKKSKHTPTNNLFNKLFTIGNVSGTEQQILGNFGEPHASILSKHVRLLNAFILNCFMLISITFYLLFFPFMILNVYRTIVKWQNFCNIIKKKRPIYCSPLPDAFNPCEDVMGKEYLRILVWLVAFAAVSGNVAVIVVLIR